MLCSLVLISGAVNLDTLFITGTLPCYYVAFFKPEFSAHILLIKTKRWLFYQKFQITQKCQNCVLCAEENLSKVVF